MEHMNFQIPGMAQPTIMNPPPQIFGAYGPDGLPLPQLPPDLAAYTFTDSMLMDDSTEAKRRRIAKACDMCRKKKIKCDGKVPACSHCINYKTECIFTQVEKKRSPPKGAKYIEGLENRLGRMEHILRLSGVLDEEDGSTDLSALEKRLEEKQQRSRRASAMGTATPESPSQAASGVEAASSPSLKSVMTSPDPNSLRHEKPRSESADDAQERDEDVESLSEMMCSLVTNQSGETRYIGSSSGFSIFSPRGIQWVNGKTGDESFQEMISEVSIDDHKWNQWKPDVFSDLFTRRIFLPLPPKHETLSLLTDYFENFNCMCPLFHQPTFMHLVERQYSSDPYGGSGWWASLNCALAIAFRLRVMSQLVPREEDEKAWGYIKNAMAVFSELTMRNTDLLSVQGLLGMALFMQGTPNPQPAFLLVAAAIRLSHSIGLHKKGTGFNLNPIEIEQRKRVFWIAYMLDKDLCLRSGRPPAQYDDDMNVELPGADPADNIGNIPLADGKGKMNLFRAICEFSIIESSVYRRLYSTNAMKQSPGETLNTIGELDKQLEEWKDTIPIDFRPEHEIKASHTPLILHVVMLHLSYYNCLMTIHRMSVHHGYWTSRLSNYAIQGMNARPLNPRIFSSAALSTAASRASIALLKYIPQGDFSCVWMILYFPVSALFTLFGNILQNPMDPRAKSDIRLMNLVVTFLSMLGEEAEQGGVHRMLGVCSEFERIAKKVIEKAEKEQSNRRKRKNVDVSSTKSASTSNVNGSPSAKGPGSKATSTTYLNMPPPNNFGSGSASGQSNSSIAERSPILHVDQSATLSPHSTKTTDTSPSLPSASWSNDTAVPQDFEFDSFSDLTGFPADYTFPPMDEPLSAASTSAMPFQQPHLPQDLLFSLPMTLDWNWAEMSGGAYPGLENGNFGGPDGGEGRE